VFYVGSPPAVSGFSPTSGTPGTAVTLTGTDLHNATSVTLGGVAASFTVAGPNQINTTVPAGLAPGSYTWHVTTPIGSASSASPFTVLSTGPASATYNDAVGDGGCCAPDVGTVRVSNDASGYLTFDVDTLTDPYLLYSTDFVVFFDSDRNPVTGDVGDDHAIVIDGATNSIGLFGWTGTGWVFVPTSTLSGSWSYGPTINIHRDELSGTSQFGFWIASGWAGYYDFAPEAGWWYYGLGYGAGSLEGSEVTRGAAAPSRLASLALPANATPIAVSGSPAEVAAAEERRKAAKK
jgi:hypothetical protein